MKTKRNLVNLTLVGAMAAALCLAGCGNRLPAAPIEDPAAAVDEPAPIESTDPLPTDPMTPSMPTTGAPAYEQPVVTGSLVVSGVEKDKHGLIFRTLEAKGQVMNTSSVPLSGTLTIEFKKKKGIINRSLETSETKTQIVPQIQPGQSYSFTVESEHSADDVEITVATNQPATTSAAGYGSPYGAAASNPYGAAANPYGAQASNPYGNPYGAAPQSTSPYGYGY